MGIHFSVPADGKDKHFRLEGKIVRVMDTGVGINFAEGMDEDALNTLSDYSGLKPVPEPAPAGKPETGQDAKQAGPATSSSPFQTGGLKPDDAKKIVAALRKEAAQVIPEMINGIFSYMDTELLELAKDAKSNAEQSEYFAAMSTLEKAKKQVGQEFGKEILNQFDEPRDLNTLLEARRKANEERKAQMQQRVKLSLINTDEFEDWLAVANIISRSERMYEKFMDELLQRMGMIVDSWSHAEANPLGTAVFTHAFDEAMQKVDLNKEVRQKIYTGYDNIILPLFRKLYIATTKLLEDSGLFPDLDEDYITPSEVTKPKQEEKEEVEEPPEEEPEEIEED